MESIVALIALTLMEVVLGIDNIVFISILSSRLPKEQQKKAQQVGLLVALGSRILLLCTLSWILGMTAPLFDWTSLGMPEGILESLSHGDEEAFAELNSVSMKDIVLIVGGLFLIWKSVHEIHAKLEGGHESHEVSKTVTYGSVIAQIAVIDIVFSLDSVITAAGMAKEIWVMVTAVIVAVIVMLVFVNTVSQFVEKHPTVKMLALSFLILIGVLLVSEGIGTHFNKGYVYFAMAFALLVEFLNLKMRTDKYLHPSVDSSEQKADA